MVFPKMTRRAENRPLNVPLIAPFIIASSRLEMVENVAIRIELSNGSVGWGEAPILSFVIAEDQKTAMAKASEACAFLRRCPLLTLGSMLEEIAAILPGHEFATNLLCLLCNWECDKDTVREGKHHVTDLYRKETLVCITAWQKNLLA
ncbi:hypothetical protein HN873_005233 [Arachis hypogaea]